MRYPMVTMYLYVRKTILIYSQYYWQMNDLHFCRSISGPRQQAEIPHAISLKSMWLSLFSSNALNKPVNKIG